MEKEIKNFQLLLADMQIRNAYEPLKLLDAARDIHKVHQAEMRVLQAKVETLRDILESCMDKLKD
jgi:hypothetical protein